MAGLADFVAGLAEDVCAGDEDGMMARASARIAIANGGRKRAVMTGDGITPLF